MWTASRAAHPSDAMHPLPASHALRAAESRIGCSRHAPIVFLLEFSEWQGPPCSAKRIRVRRTRPKLLRIKGAGRREWQGRTGLGRLAIGPWRIGGDEAGKVDGFTVVAVALMWGGDEVIAAPRFIIAMRQRDDFLESMINKLGLK